MGYLIIKMLRDIKKYWMQFISVFFMALISIMIFSGMASVWNGASISAKNYSNRTNLADQWVYTKGFNENIKDELKDIKGVRKVTLASSLQTTLSGTENNVKLNAMDNTDCLKPELIEGEKYDVNSDGIWLDSKFAKKNRIKIGDEISLEFKMKHQSFKVKGFVLDSEYIYYTGSFSETIPNHKKYGYAFVSKENFNKLSPYPFYTEIRLKTDAKISESKLKNVVGESYIKTSTRENLDSYNTLKKETDQMKKMSVLFSMIFILLSLLTMYTSMVRLIGKQKIIIGTMKAIGINKSTIRLHYAFYGFIISALGSVVGLILGRKVTSPSLLKVKQTVLTMPHWDLIQAHASYLLIALMILICMSAALFATNKALKGMPAETMRNANNMDIVAKQPLIEKSNFIWSKISYYWRWVLRDISRNKIRFVMGIVGVMGGMVLLVAGLGIKQSIDYSNDYVFDKQYNYEVRAVIVDSRSISKVNTEKQLNYETEMDLKFGGQTKKEIFVASENKNLIRYEDMSGKLINLDNESAVITHKLATKLNIKKGDYVKIRLLGENDWVNVKISNITKTLSPQGIAVSKKYYEENFGEFNPNVILANNISEGELKDIGGFNSIITKARQRSNLDELVESVNSIVRLLIMASFLLTIIILYNLGTLNFIEKTREYATLKVLGFMQKEIRGIVIKDCILVIAIGWIIGIFVSTAFLKVYVKIVCFDNFEWIAFINFKLLAICSLTVIATSLIINLIMSAKVRKIDMVESLKSVE